ncbi:hypothetical protein Pint_08137 [Pistacia integerrima]|uniref:Uncharacterized protein n=1 Tax=Pistacia integerrima TaxID=434235 RepID=A0ACC0XZK5_9ROSI|nr:hypothetical protein Pint_08137 [Pistacia integerrima]
MIINFANMVVMLKGVSSMTLYCVSSTNPNLYTMTSRPQRLPQVIVTHRSRIKPVLWPTSADWQDKNFRCSR